MIHYLLLKFKPGFFSDEVFSMAVEVFTGIGKALAGIEDVQVSRNCSPRNTNADLLVRMTLEGHEALEAYLEHPLHRSFAEEIEPCISRRLTFDCMEMERLERRETS